MVLTRCHSAFCYSRVAHRTCYACWCLAGFSVSYPCVQELGTPSVPEEDQMYGKAITTLLILAGGTYASTSVLQDFLEGTLDMISITAANAEMKLIHSKFAEYRTLNNQKYPGEYEVKPFLQEEFETDIDNVLRDPWTNLYMLLGPLVEIRCMGPDQKQQTRDDLLVKYPPGVKPPSWAVRRGNRPLNVR